MLGSYIEKIRQNSIRRIPTQIGLDLGRFISWLFSVNGLFLLLVGAVISVVAFIIKQSGSTGNNNEYELQLLSITLTVTLSTLIPTMISRIVTKNQLNDIIDQKLDTELLKYKTSLNNIRRDKGHASRMSAVLLEQMADSTGRDAEHIQTCQDNAAWAIGWASDAIIQYVLIRDVYTNALKNSAACINIIYKAAKHIKTEQDKIKSNIKLGDLKSLVTMHSLIEQCGLIENLQKESLEQRSQEQDEFSDSEDCLLPYQKDFQLIDAIQNIEKAFYSRLKEQSGKSINFSNFCTITGMSAEFNEVLNRYAERVIMQMQSNNSSGQIINSVSSST